MTKTIRRKRNSEVEAGYERVQLQEVVTSYKPKELVTRADRMVEDFVSVRNRPVYVLAELYPSMPWKWKCDHYYPQYDLYVDEPSSLHVYHSMEAKKDFMKSQGKKYVLLKPGADSFEDKEELNKCGL